VLLPHTEHEKPTNRNALAEYTAFKRLQRYLPVTFVNPPAEHMAYDFVVHSKKWKLKMARLQKQKDYWVVNCHKKKNAGNVNGKPTSVQYAVDDFDYMCVQLPKIAPHCCYVIPQQELAKRGVLGDASKSDGAVRMYPHLASRSMRNDLVNGVHWTEAFRIILDQNPLPKAAVHPRALIMLRQIRSPTRPKWENLSPEVRRRAPGAAVRPLRLNLPSCLRLQ
jgi:hypothetical protein